MIIQIRGTSGSGKSWVMRQWMGPTSLWEPATRIRRRHPIYYVKDEVYVLGHYESPCGGCDTIGSARQVYDLIAQVGKHVPKAIVCEGLLLSEDVKWTSKLAEDHEVKVIYLNTNVEKCIEQIKRRRRAAGNEKPLKEDNTRNRVRVIERSREKLSKLGVFCRLASARQAPGLIRRWIDAI